MDYPRDWVTKEFRFWTKQYLLQAFLSFNAEFDVLMANNYLGLYYLEDLKATFPNLPSLRMGSFWMRGDFRWRIQLENQSVGFAERLLANIQGVWTLSILIVSICRIALFDEVIAHCSCDFVSDKHMH